MQRREIKLTEKQILCIKLVKYWDKYTEMHGQQNDKYTEMHGQQNDKKNYSSLDVVVGHFSNII